MTTLTRNTFGISIKTRLYSAVVAALVLSDQSCAGSIDAIIQEVLVTAQKKSVAEKLQSVPIAISAFSDAKIEATKAITLTDIGLSIPNTNLASIGTIPGVANFVIRGIGTVGASIPSQDPSVGVVMDGMAYGTIYGVVTDLFDLQSIEVLRGPQGTLFGRNVTGGALVLNSKRPTKTFEGKVQADLGNYDHQAYSVLLSGPLTDTFGGKISVLYKEHGGYWENRTLGGKHGAAESLVIRPTLSYEDDNLALTLITEHGSMKGDGAGVQTYFADGVKLFEPFKDNFTLQDRTETSDLTWTNAIVEVVWDVFSGSLTSVLGYRELDQEFGSDLDGFLGDRFAWIDGTGLEQDQTSLEVRWAGQLSDKVSLTTGIHLFSQDYTYSERRLLSRVFDRRGRSTIDHSTASLFAQSDINLFEPLVLTLGGRYTRETKDAAVGIIGDPAATGGCRTVDLRNESPGTSFDSLDATANLSDCKQPFKDKESWSNFSPKVGLAWTVNDDFMAYASFTRGFRSGGYNVRFTSANPLTSPGPYNEEVVDAYELGFKSTILDGRFRFNFALFNNSFDDLQRTVLDSSGTQATLNAATATIKGAEIETVLLLTDNLVVEGSFGYTDSGGSGSSDRNLVLISG